MKRAALMPEAETLYVRRGLTLEAIATQLRISPSTVSRWCKRAGWQRKRAEWLKNSALAPLDKLKERRLKLIERMSEQIEDDPTIEDRLVKISKVIEEMEARAEAIGPVLDALERFVRYAVATCDDGQMAVVRDVVDRFLAAVRQDQA